MITVDPGSQFLVAIGGNVQFSVTVQGAELSYQWRRNNVDLSDETDNIDGATSESLDISNAQSVDAGTYTVVVTNPAAVSGIVSAPASLVTSMSFIQ